MNDVPKRESHAQQEGRVTASLAGLAFVIALVVVGFFLVKVLQKQSALEDCLMSGRTNCAPIETGR
jgi:flagellar biogenesis protein FliO